FTGTSKQKIFSLPTLLLLSWVISGSQLWHDEVSY
ncbi:unnamed protein product, partial [Allacma fusca]